MNEQVTGFVLYWCFDQYKAIYDFKQWMWKFVTNKQVYAWYSAWRDQYNSFYDFKQRMCEFVMNEWVADIEMCRSISDLKFTISNNESANS